MKRRIFTIIILFVAGLRLCTGAVQASYAFPWPGVLPDRPILYKIKVFRNKLILKMLSRPVSRIEFELLMADKTLYAAKLLLEKGKTALAKETALKGENYMSMLVSEYSKVANVPLRLEEKIDQAYPAHQDLIARLGENYKDVDYFSKTNYTLIQKIRNDRKK